jgi:hypothetical protein
MCEPPVPHRAAALTTTTEGQKIMNGPATTGCRGAAASMSAIADRLAGHGLKVTLPHRPGSHTLTITSPGHLRCTLALDDDGPGCEATIAPARGTTPAQVAPLAAHLLGTTYPDPARHAHLHRGTTLAGAVARDLTARGLHARMDVIEDHDSYHAFADVIITNPAEPGHGRIHLGDDGWLSWECDTGELPGGPGGLAATLATALTHTPPPTAGARLRGLLRGLPFRR